MYISPHMITDCAGHATGDFRPHHRVPAKHSSRERQRCPTGRRAQATTSRSRSSRRCDSLNRNGKRPTNSANKSIDLTIKGQDALRGQYALVFEKLGVLLANGYEL